MEVFRHSYFIKNNKLIIKLPRNFKATKVDVIVLPAEEKDWYDDLTIEQKKSIEIGRDQLQNDEGIPNKEVQKRIRKIIDNKKIA